MLTYNLIEVNMGYPGRVHGLSIGYEIGYFLESVHNNKNKIHVLLGIR
jgi:hypothetical protein